jgi:hypothetical protein
MEGNAISEKEFTRVLRTTLNWKDPGRDQKANSCFKQLTATGRYLATLKETERRRSNTSMSNRRSNSSYSKAW